MPYRASGFRWTDDDGSHDHPLAYPLLRMRPSVRRASWSRDTIGGVVHTAKATAAVYDVEAAIRFEASPQALLDALCSRVGNTITYYEDRGGIVEWNAVLAAVNPGGSGMVGIEPDPDRFSRGEYSTTVRLRFASAADAAAVYEAIA